jgi:hypothetical protein
VTATPIYISLRRIQMHARTRQAIKAERSIKGRLCNHCCSGNAMNITFSHCLCVRSRRYPACSLHSLYCLLCLVRLYCIFQHYLINRTIKKKAIGHKMCFYFLYNFCLKHFSFYEELSEVLSNMYIGLHVGYPLFLLDFNKT